MATPVDPSLVASTRRFRILVALLSAISVLLLLVLAALVAGGLYAAHVVSALTPRGAQGGPVALAKQAETELTQRQQRFEHQLTDVGDGTLKELGGFSTRREGLSDTSGGLLKKLDTTIRLNQLLADEMLVLLKNLSQMEKVVAHGAQPLPEQRDLERREQARPAPSNRRK